MFVSSLESVGEIIETKGEILIPLVRKLKKSDYDWSSRCEAVPPKCYIIFFLFKTIYQHHERGPIVLEQFLTCIWATNNSLAALRLRLSPIVRPKKSSPLLLYVIRKFFVTNGLLWNCSFRIWLLFCSAAFAFGNKSCSSYCIYFFKVFSTL